MGRSGKIAHVRTYREGMDVGGDQGFVGIGASPENVEKKKLHLLHSGACFR